ncbi:hypothetical protein GCM10025870_06000 [Agromyces marinus]|uniref:Helicase ATP-binding domain-containing protein n=1 Tax=Agromyces marinus TaxID=1389020 RepID=A0ABM8GYH2_9MICO|nr:hypothetical protein GCM10025870_06000 [Agromyces marinus]
MAQSRQQTQSRQRQRTRSRDDDAPIIPILARKVREVEQKAQKNKLGPTNRTKFQVIALLMREERARVKGDTEIGDAARAELLKRLDGIAQILAKTAARDTSLITLLEPDASISTVAQRFRRDWLLESGADLSEDELIIVREPEARPVVLSENQVIPRSVRSRQLANPFLAPDFAASAQPAVPVRRLANWELLGPLFKSFESGSGGQAASMELPAAPKADRLSPRGLELMPHQARFIESARQGHRRFLLADEPGLGKTAQSVLAASVSGAYPLLAVVPNVVKMNWAREVERWTPHRRATVIHGDGDTVDAFADVVVVNYDVLDRHLAWLSTLGFRGMVVDEAHFIKNLQSQRSRNVLALAERIRANTPGGDPLLLALTGTPLINDVDDFRAIWQFLGWIDGDRPSRNFWAGSRRLGSPQPTPGSTPRPGSRSSTSASSDAARRTSRPTCPTSASPISPWSSTTNSAGRSARPSESSATGSRRASDPSWSRAGSEWATSTSSSATSSSAPSRCPSSRSRSPRSPARTSSRWFGASARRRRASRPITRPSWPDRPARSCSSPSTSTSWTRLRPPSRRASCGRCRSVATRARSPASRRSMRSTPTPRSRSRCARSPPPASA